MLTGSMMQQHRMWQSWYWTGVERHSIDEYPVALWWLFDSVRCALLFWFQASSYFLKQLVKIPTRTNTLHTIYCIIVIKCRISGNTRKSKAKQEGSQKKIGFIYHGLDLCYWTHWKLAAFSILIQNTPSLVSWNCKRRLQLQTDPTTLLPLAALVCVGARALHAPNVSRSISSLSADLHVLRPVVTTQEHVLCVRILRMEEAICRPPISTPIIHNIIHNTPV